MEEDSQDRKNIKLLITIITSLLLTLAFFSTYFPKGDYKYKNELLIFIFGLITLIFLFLNYINKKRFLKYIGYGFASSFATVFLFFLVDNLFISYFGSPFRYSFNQILILFKSNVIRDSLLIGGIVSLLCFIVKERLKKNR